MRSIIKFFGYKYPKDCKKMSHQRLSLKELNKDNFYAICQLSVKTEPLGYVDSNAISMAEANFSEHAWMRGIFLDEEPVGFVIPVPLI